jgi:hypothetical protein
MQLVRSQAGFSSECQNFLKRKLVFISDKKNYEK